MTSVFVAAPLYFLFSLYALQLGLTALGLRLTEVAFGASLLAAGLLASKLHERKKFSHSVQAAIFVVLLLLLCLIPTALVSDTSHDGQTYHQAAVYLFHSGWNFFAPRAEDIAFLNNLHPDFATPLMHYPKFPWIIAGTFAEMTGHIEAGKALTLFLLITSGLISFVAARAYSLSKFSSALLSFALSLNPVILCQVWTFYIDGILAAIILIILSSAALFLRTNSLSWLWIVALGIILLLNTKFTALLFVASFVSGFGLLLLLLQKQHIVFIAVFSVLVTAFGLLLFGYHPYVTNLRDTGNPIYPAIGYSPLNATPDTAMWPGVKLLDGQQPQVLAGRAGPIKAVLSLLARTCEPFRFPDKLEFFWQSELSDYSRFSTPDLRLGAFGPVFPLALLLGLGTFASTFKEQPNKNFALILFAVIILSVVLNPESWWARYAPQIWLFPFALCFGHRRVLIVVSLFLLLSSLTIATINTRAAVARSKELRDVLAKLSVYSGQTLPGQIGGFYASIIRLKQIGINVRETQTPCDSAVFLPGSPTRVCLPEKVETTDVNR